MSTKCSASVKYAGGLAVVPGSVLLDSETFDAQTNVMTTLLCKAIQDLQMAEKRHNRQCANMSHMESMWLTLNLHAAWSHMMAASRALLSIIRDKHRVVARPPRIVAHRTPRKVVRGVNGRRPTRKRPVPSKARTEENERHELIYNRLLQASHLFFHEIQNILRVYNYAAVCGLIYPARSYRTNLPPRAAYDWRVSEVRARIRSVYECLLRPRAPLAVRQRRLIFA